MKIIGQNPLGQIMQRDFEYAFDFNRLEPAEQKAAVDALLSASSPGVYRTASEENYMSENFFELKAVIVQRGRAHILVYLKSNWVGPEIDWDVGKINTLFFLTDKKDLPADNPWTLAGHPGFLCINDFEWKDRYKIYTLNLNRDIVSSELNFFLMQPYLPVEFLSEKVFDPKNWKVRVLRKTVLTDRQK